MEENSKKQIDTKTIIFASMVALGVMIIYRKGVKHGYNDAMDFVESTIKTIVDSMEISKF